MNWRDFARCRGLDPQEASAIFHPPTLPKIRRTPEQRLRAEAERVAPAMRMCAQCPAIEPCLEDALADPAEQDLGIRGMTTPEDRREIRRQRGQVVAVNPREQKLRSLEAAS